MYSDISGYAPEWLKWVGLSVLAIAVVAIAVVTAGAVIAAAPALAAFAQSMAFALTGSLAAGAFAASVVSYGAAAIAISTIAIGLNEGINLMTGNNYMRNVMGDKGYNTFSATVGFFAYSYILAGSMLPYPSTGNNQPTNLKSSITLNASKSNPASGMRLFNLNDPRMPGWLGWSKYQMTFSGNTIHYVGNRYLQGWYPFEMWFDYKIVAESL